MKLVLRSAIILLIALTAVNSAAATYNRFEDVVRNTSGNSVASAAIYVYAADTDSLVPLYSTRTGTVKVNPVKSDATGRYWFYLPTGRYDLVITRYGIGRTTIEDVQVGSTYDGDAAFTGNVSVADTLTAHIMKGSVTTTGAIVSQSTIVSYGTIYGAESITTAGDLSTVDGGNLYLDNKAAMVRSTGSPETNIYAPVGTIFLRTDGTAQTPFYVKATGTGPTGWVAPLDILSGNVTVGGDLDVTGMDISLYGTRLITAGEGSPEGAVTAVVGCIYLRLNGGVGSTLYVKQSGTGNTGWAAK
jgi:hypothetical protein